ncbi:hypothetical protein J1N35_033848 [Gossypium stocksii]|uniref:Uncharacterized protein n=1 Tax=Gossypium stocksii TaxID=47602 RepID=A0A9D3UR31_9ROSI|nr:hypothetical protein J1N35_033848 [Gossypium stocksii]
MHLPVLFLEYIKIWENRYDHIPTRESIIVLKLVCTSGYIPWFKIHDLLSKEQRHWQIRVEKERWSPLNPMKRYDIMSPSIGPTQSPGPMPQVRTPTPQPLQIMPGGIARGIVRELISFPILIVLWNSNTSTVGDANTSVVGDANTSAFFILSRRVILPTPTTRTTTTPAEATTTLARS